VSIAAFCSWLYNT